MAAKSLKVKRDPAIDAARTHADRVKVVLYLIAGDICQAPLLKTLAAEYGWSAYTISSWINQGFVPIRKAELLHAHFHERVCFEISDLCPARKAKVLPRGRNAHKNK